MAEAPAISVRRRNDAELASDMNTLGRNVVGLRLVPQPVYKPHHSLPFGRVRAVLGEVGTDLGRTRRLFWDGTACAPPFAARLTQPVAQRSPCSGVSAGASGRRRKPAATPSPTAAKMKGEAHNNHVRASKGGRKSTKSP